MGLACDACPSVPACVLVWLGLCYTHCCQDIMVGEVKLKKFVIRPQLSQRVVAKHNLWFPLGTNHASQVMLSQSFQTSLSPKSIWGALTFFLVAELGLFQNVAVGPPNSHSLGLLMP